MALIFNDGAYGNAERTQRELYGNRVIASDLSNPDFVRVRRQFWPVRALGQSLNGLPDALEQALARNEPALIGVKVGEFPNPWQYIVLPRWRLTTQAQTRRRCGGSGARYRPARSHNAPGGAGSNHFPVKFLACVWLGGGFVANCNIV